jgi:hypothetical protein
MALVGRRVIGSAVAIGRVIVCTDTFRDGMSRRVVTENGELVA